jgi:hypothetical protein
MDSGKNDNFDRNINGLFETIATWVLAYQRRLLAWQALLAALRVEINPFIAAQHLPKRWVCAGVGLRRKVNLLRARPRCSRHGVVCTCASTAELDELQTSANHPGDPLPVERKLPQMHVAVIGIDRRDHTYADKPDLHSLCRDGRRYGHIDSLVAYVLVSGVMTIRPACHRHINVCTIR